MKQLISPIVITVVALLLPSCKKDPTNNWTCTRLIIQTTTYPVTSTDTTKTTTQLSNLTQGQAQAECTAGVDTISASYGYTVNQTFLTTN